MTAYEQLVARYADVAPAIRRDDRVYPVAVDAARGTMVVVEDAEVAVAAAVRRLGEPYLRDILERSSWLHDGRLLALWSSDGPVLRLRYGGYFAMLATCDALQAEFAARAETDGLLPLRDAVHAAAGDDPVRSGVGRVAAVGVSVVTTVPHADGRAFIVGRRSAALPTDPGRWHVAPSGMLEPAGGDDALVATVARELSEELGVAVGARNVAARLEVLGVAHDLTRLRPEICARLDLSAAEAREVRVAEEFDRLEFVELTDTALAAFWREHDADGLTPAAAGAVALLEVSLQG